MIFRPPFARGLVFWDGDDPMYDAAILMTVYRAEATLEEAVISVFDQDVEAGTRVQFILGIDPYPDGTLELARALATRAPAWIDMQLVENPLPNMVIGGRRTARSNFLNAYRLIRAPVVFYLNCDDRWLTRSKLRRQLEHVRETGRACCTALQSEAVRLAAINRDAEVKNPFHHGTTLQISSLAMPYLKLGHTAFWWTVPFLDLPLICRIWSGVGIDRLVDEETYYRFQGSGSWSSVDVHHQYALIRRTVLQMCFQQRFRLHDTLKLLAWMREQKPRASTR